MTYLTKQNVITQLTKQSSNTVATSLGVVMVYSKTNAFALPPPTDRADAALELFEKLVLPRSKSIGFLDVIVMPALGGIFLILPLTGRAKPGRGDRIWFGALRAGSLFNRLLFRLCLYHLGRSTGLDWPLDL